MELSVLILIREGELRSELEHLERDLGSGFKPGSDRPVKDGSGLGLRFDLNPGQAFMEVANRNLTYTN